jgi:hypothetical protein
VDTLLTLLGKEPDDREESDSWHSSCFTC